MSRIYATKLPEEIHPEEFDKLELLISDKRRQAIKHLRRIADKKRALLAEILLRYALKLDYGIQAEQVQFEFNRYGKPRLLNYKDVNFNLSHSGQWVLCGISTDSIGVDVEQIGNANLDIAKHYFMKREYDEILRRPPEEQKTMFYNLWTLKESYIKAEGVGLSKPLNSFGFEIQSNHIVFCMEEGEKNVYCFQLFNLDSSHIGAICTKDPGNKKIEVVSYHSLLDLNNTYNTH